MKRRSAKLRVPCPVPQVHWRMVIADIVRYGISMQRMATESHISKASLGRYYREGAEPHHAVGERIIDIWIEVTGRTRAELPRMARTDFRF